MNSNLWLAVIVVGAILAAAGNIQYSRSREYENQLEMADQAMALLRPEIQRNFQMIEEMQKLAQNNSYNLTSPFETEAWLTVSKSSLLTGLESNYLSNLMRSYYLMNQANLLHSRIMENLQGVASALQNSNKNVELLNNDFRVAIRDLKPVLEELISKNLPAK